MYPNRVEEVIIDNVTPVAIGSSTNATPIVVTATAHGLTTGQRVFIYGHATNTNANGIFKVGVTTANTFQLLDEVTGAGVAGNGVGSGTGFCMLAPLVLTIPDFNRITFMVTTGGSATTTIVAAGSLGIGDSQQHSPRLDYPNIGATVNVANPWTEYAITDKLSGSVVAGGTGVVASGTDICKQYDILIEAAKYVTAFPISWTQGAITVKMLVDTAV